jgi:hypothetical protein
VWKSTKTIGAGIAQAANNGWLYMTADYFPAGNMIGGTNNNQYFIQNVLKPSCKPKK